MASNPHLQAQHGPLARALVPPWPSREAFEYVLHRLDITNFRHGLPWHNLDYYPAPKRRGRRSTLRAANHLILSNHQNVGVCRLPTEILMCIGDQLSEVGLLALRATCRQMRFCVPLERGAHQDPVSDFDKWYFAMRMYIDRYSNMAYCELVRPRIPLTQSLPCSFCLALHPRTAFSKENREKSPYQRTCKGAGGYLRMCQHEHLTFTQLRRQAEKLQRWSAAIYLCSETSHHGENDCFPGKYSQPALRRGPLDDIVRLRTGFALEMRLESHIESPRRDRRKNGSSLVWNEKGFEKILAEADVYICPHLRTSTPHLWHRRPANNEELYQFFALHESGDIRPSDGECIFYRFGECIFYRFGECGHPGCETAFAYDHEVSSLSPDERRHTTYFNPISFQVWRKLGALKDVQDPAWLAQVESV